MTILVVILFLLSPAVVLAVEDDNQIPDHGDFYDIDGHWAEATLRQAYSDGLLFGADGYLLPDAYISTAQVIAVLCRVLGAEIDADISDWGLSEELWYYDYLAKAVYKGLISSGDQVVFNDPISRQDAFYFLTGAFHLAEAKPDVSLLEQYSDHSLIAGNRRQVIASLAALDLIQGHDGRMRPGDSMTRAEFFTVVYRIAGEYLMPAALSHGSYPHGIMLQGSASISGSVFHQGVWFNSAAENVRLNSVSADIAVIRSHLLTSLVVDGASVVDRLTLAAQSGDVIVSPSATAVVNTLIVGKGSGQITVNGIGNVEITGDSRKVVITGKTDSVLVSGSNNVVHIQPGAQVGKIELLRSAGNSLLVIDSNVEEVEILCVGAVIEGIGHAELLVIPRTHTSVNISYGGVEDSIDHGLLGAEMVLGVPAVLPAGSTLAVTAQIENVLPGMSCNLVWYLDEEPVLEALILTGDELPVLTHVFEYSMSMQDNASVRAEVTYVTLQGEQQSISASGEIVIENYGRDYWTQLEAPRVLRDVTSGYRGDFTLEWALANDLSDEDKEVWVNAKGYTSDTGYLLWVNTAYQRVYVFSGSAGDWDLIETFIVGTGARRTPTRAGVTTITYRQTAGWNTGTYTVRPVVRFWPGSGFAFHSRVYYPRSSRLLDDRIGFPVSLGCVRMYDEDIWYIHDNIPNGTTVVVF